MSEQVFAWMFQGGNLIDNFQTLGAVATVSFTVPAGKRWLVMGGDTERDQNATFIVEVFNAADKALLKAGAAAAGNTHLSWGCMSNLSTIQNSFAPFFLKAGDYIKYTYGAAQTTPEVTCIILEIDAP